MGRKEKPGKSTVMQVDAEETDDITHPVVVVLPGEAVQLPSNVSTVVRLGPGLRQDADGAAVTKAGVLRQTAQGDKVWVEGNQRRYVPQLNESVLGVISAKLGENYRVDIGGPHPAMLGVLAFEGATKRNRPNLEIGSLVFARVSLANKDMEPELDCINPTNGKADGFGEVKGGFMFKCSLGLSRSLLDPSNPFLQHLGNICPFETAVGMNGRVWLRSDKAKQTILIMQALLESETIPYNKARAHIKKFKAELGEK
ncbi:exosome non-catalytic core subunit rrp40 [Chytriomyces hyalinus]|nr:exosome non-catalytic core subunit rrp40 [Chytriomyces hyalinus]